MSTDQYDEDIQKMRNISRKSLHLDSRRNSVLPFQWRITHSTRWMGQVVASEFSLVAFVLMLVMVFSREWLHPSGSRFYQRCGSNVTNRIHTSIHFMTMGILYICKSRSCSKAETWEELLELWTSQPVFAMAKLSFALALGLGLVLTTWLHLPYLPQFWRLPAFGLVGTILSFCEVTLMFFTLLLFPINLWIFELKRNVSVPIGWSYFIGWLVFILYIVCVLCYLNHKTFWSVIMGHPSSKVACSSDLSNSAQDFEINHSISDSSTNKEKVLDPE